jgi:hypothetical protein
MEAAVHGIFVFGVAVAAHGEWRHGGVRPVVRNAGDDGISGTAVCAVNEWIEKAPVTGVEKLAKTVSADIAVR